MPEAREPILHAGVLDCLPEDHPLAFECIHCECCGEMVHAANNETMQAWVEGGLGAFCLPCFAYSPEDADLHWLPGNENPEVRADLIECVRSKMKDGR